jgi:hypothetical protein
MTYPAVYPKGTYLISNYADVSEARDQLSPYRNIL